MALTLPSAVSAADVPAQAFPLGHGLGDGQQELGQVAADLALDARRP